MSGYQVVSAVGETLRSLLWSEMQHDSEITPILPSEQRISFEPPFKLVKDTDPDQNYLSLYLYRVVESAERKNRELEQLDLNTLGYPPLYLDLSYLITPLSKTTENDHKLLGKTMRILYDNAIVRQPDLQGVLAGTSDELRVVFDPISFEDMTKLWSSFMRSYRASLSYGVKAVYIDSQRQIESERVRRKRIEFSQVGV